MLRPAAAKNESFPVHRKLVDLREAAFQTVGRDGPRYPDDGFLAAVDRYRAVYPSNSTTSEHASEGHCSGGYAVLTMGNNFAMETLVPLLLESLRRIELPSSSSSSSSSGSTDIGAPPANGNGNAHHHLARHALVVGVTTPAFQACIRLRRRYKNGCLSDTYSGLSEGDHTYPHWRFLAYGLAKLKYIVNVLSSGTDVLYVDADVVFLQNPFPGLLLPVPPEGGGADIAVATAAGPCGTAPTRPDWAAAFLHDSAEDDDEGGAGGGDAEGHAGGSQQRQIRHSLLQGEGGATAEAVAAAAAAAARGYSPGITFYRSNPGVVRCVYSLLLDMFSAVVHWNGTSMPTATAQNSTAGPVVLEQEHFAQFMPACAEALGLHLAELPSQEYITSCGVDAADASVGQAAVTGASGSGGVVAVHVSGALSGSSLRDRLPQLQRLLGVRGSDLMHAAANILQPEEGVQPEEGAEPEEGAGTAGTQAGTDVVDGDGAGGEGGSGRDDVAGEEGQVR